MKSEYEISMDYNRAMSMTRELEELAVKFRNLTQQEAFQRLNYISANWKGENAEHFTRKAGDYLRKTTSISDYLEKVAGLIKQNAQNVYNAEMTALRIAQQRSYH